ncbi:hypothetical protein U3516DRAFT_676255 [Neocallimastix sp. 'constans']
MGIILNDNKYILHKEYFTSDDYYYLYAHSDNWYFEIINKKSYLKSAINDDICLIVDNDKIITGKCSENIDKARISYNEPKNYIEYFNSSNKQYKCISGIDDRNNRNSPQYLTLANCNKKDEKMIWEIKTTN